MDNYPELPNHVAIIMDGNGRWAKSQHKPRISGHKQGRNTVRAVIKAAAKLNIPVVSFFAFSTENWGRPKSEITMIMELMQKGLIDEAQNFLKENIRIRIIGNREKISSRLRQSIEKAEKLTADCTRMQVIFAIDYSGRWAMVETAKRMASAVMNGTVQIKDIDEDLFSTHRPMPDLPDVDLLIRSSGEERISNYHLWEIAYSELYFTETLWPDFNENDFQLAIDCYQKRERRYGKVHSEEYQ